MSLSIKSPTAFVSTVLSPVNTLPMSKIQSPSASSARGRSSLTIVKESGVKTSNLFNKHEKVKNIVPTIGMTIQPEEPKLKK